MTPDIVLIRALGYEGNSLPQGLLCLQAYLREHGYRSTIWDRYVDHRIEGLKNALRHVSVVGISAMSIQSADAIYLAKLIRRWYPATKILFGGVHFTALPRTARGIADHVIVGEGERAIKAYLDQKEGWPFVIDCPPLECIDDVPQFAAEDIAPLLRTDADFHLVTGRGCPYRCNFCLSKEQRPSGLRFHSVNRVIRYVEDVVTKLQIRSFNIVDDIFVLNLKRVHEICDAIETEIGGHLQFSCFTHSGHGSRGLYERLRSVGFTKISMGVEHGNDEMLEFCGKHTTKAQIEKTCEEMFDAGLQINLTYILGNAKETNDTITETVDFAIYLHRRFQTSSWFSFAEPLPGSALYENAMDYGEFLVRDLQTYSNLNPVYLPFGVSKSHLVSERRRGLELANPAPDRSRFSFWRRHLRSYFARRRTERLNRELSRVRSIVGPIIPGEFGE